jgi:hypothetical protein
LSTIYADFQALADPPQHGKFVKDYIAQAAARAGLSYWRAFDIWYGKARRIEQYERDQIAEALAKKELEALRNDLQNWRISLAKHEARLATLDADYRSPDVDLLGHDVRPGGRRRRR